MEEKELLHSRFADSSNLLLLLEARRSAREDPASDVWQMAEYLHRAIASIESASLPTLTDPTTGKAPVLDSGARLQERSLALDDRESMRRLYKKHSAAEPQPKDQFNR